MGNLPLTDAEKRRQFREDNLRKVGLAIRQLEDLAADWENSGKTGEFLVGFNVQSGHFRSIKVKIQLTTA
jgi:hypothetical protein